MTQHTTADEFKDVAADATNTVGRALKKTRSSRTAKPIG